MSGDLPCFSYEKEKGKDNDNGKKKRKEMWPPVDEGERFGVKVTSPDWEKSHVQGSVTVTFEVTSRGVRCCEPGCTSNDFGEKTGNASTTASLFHCDKHIKSKHPPAKKNVATRPITAFFQPKSKRPKVNEPTAVDEFAPWSQVNGTETWVTSTRVRSSSYSERAAIASRKAIR
mmetsp:Transcript_25410/g.82175  ORF Transcript_25410/g.82175 Transcript_25410/m.82175 type:complete len:174 (-) Transcript_25410:147-668(-)